MESTQLAKKLAQCYVLKGSLAKWFPTHGLRSSSGPQAHSELPPLPPKKENLTLKSSKFPEQRFYFEVPFPVS